MIATYQWLKEYCDITVPPARLVELMTMAGVKVEDAREVEGDTRFELEVTANRPDQLSVIGVAREVAGLLRTGLRLPCLDLVEGEEKVGDFVQIAVAAPDLCPRYVGRVISGVKVGDSPAWLKQKLAAAGIGSINNVVDITNFVLLEFGQPLHAFDLDKLAGAQIIVRRAQPGEEIVLIDNTTKKLTPDHLVIADARHPVALAGVMGGIDTEIGPFTKRVLLESAYFKPTNLRRTSKSLGVRTESSYRFERGVDPVGVELASRRAAGLICELCGGTLAKGAIDVNHIVLEPKKITLRHERLRRVLGVPLEKAAVADALSRIGIPVEDQEDSLVATVPSFRVDLQEEIDLVEEVARIHGYDNIPVETGMTVMAGVPSTFERAEEKARDLMAALSYTEVVTTSFLRPELARRVHPFSEPNPLTIRNPLRQEEGAMRLSLIPGLLMVRKTNQDYGVEAVRIFELARVYLPTGAEQPDEKHCLAILSDEDFLQVKGTVETILTQFGITPYRVEFYELPWLSRSCSARITAAGNILGFIGQVSAELQELIDLRRPVTLAEMDFDALVEVGHIERQIVLPLRFPPVERDLAFVLDERVLYESLEAAVRRSGGGSLREVRFVDLYRGKQVPPGKKSITLRIVFQLPDRTLTSDEVDQAVARIVGAVGAEFGAALRGPR